MANALAPMYITLVANLVNVGADYVLIFGKWGAPELGVMGAAWAAVMGNGAAALTGVAILLWKYGDHLREPIGHFFERRQFLLVLRTNLTLFFRTLCLLGAQFSVLAIASRLGEAQLAANAVVWQLWALVSSGVDGFAHAAETLVGNHLGEWNFEGARRFARRLIWWGVGIGTGFSLFYLLGLGTLARAFTDHGEVVEVVISLTLVIALVQPLNAVDYILDGIFIGANDVEHMLRATAIAAFGFFGPALVVFVGWLDWGLLGAWAGLRRTDGRTLSGFVSALPGRCLAEGLLPLNKKETSMPFIHSDELPKMELFPGALSGIIAGDRLMLSFLVLEQRWSGAGTQPPARAGRADADRQAQVQGWGRGETHGTWRRLFGTLECGARRGGCGRAGTGPRHLQPGPRGLCAAVQQVCRNLRQNDLEVVSWPGDPCKVERPWLKKSCGLVS